MQTNFDTEKGGLGAGYLLKPEVAERLRVTTKTLERWMKQGLVPYIKLGHGKRASVLFKWADIEKHLGARFGIAARA